MRVEAYLRILSDEGTIRAIQRETGTANASIRQTKAKRAPGGGEVWWNWKTARVAINADGVDAGVKALLLSHRLNFPTFRKYHRDSDVYLELVTQYEEGEEPSGLFLSAETIQLLGEMGAALDNDVIVVAKTA